MTAMTAMHPSSKNNFMKAYMWLVALLFQCPQKGTKLKLSMPLQNLVTTRDHQALMGMRLGTPESYLNMQKNTKKQDALTQKTSNQSTRKHEESLSQP